MNRDAPISSNDYSNIDSQIRGIISTVTRYMPKVDAVLVAAEITRAYLYARDAHEGQFRQSGDPYIIHPIEAVKIMLPLKPDIITIQACILHDVAEDTTRTIEEIGTEF
jgi:GTP pyrophosphokinase